MKPFRSNHRFIPWLAAVGGILLGVLARPVFRGPDSGVSGERETHSRTRSSRARHPDSPSVPLGGGPATGFLREVAGAGAADCEVLALEFFESGEAGREIEMEAVFRRWLGFESPVEILGKLNAVESRTRTDWNAAFFHAWVAVDEAAAMADTEYMQLNPARALFAVAHGDPDFARCFTNTNHSFSFEERAAAALSKLARDRPEVASLIAGAELSSDMKEKGMHAVARGWAMSNPEGALAWVRSLDLESPGSLLGAVFSEWLKTDPEAAAAARERLGLTDSDFGSRSDARRLLTAMAGPKQAPNQLLLALHRDPFMDVAALHEQLSQADIDWDKPGYQGPAINQDGWYGVDPAADAAAARRLPPGDARDFIMTSICSNWAAHDLPAALRFADENGISSSYLDRLKNKPTGEMRRAVFSDPERYVSVLLDPDAPAPDGMSRSQLGDLAEEWTKEDPIGAANWLIGQELPKWNEPGGLEAGLLFSNTIGHHWARIDPFGAGRWLESLPDGPNRSRAWTAMLEAVTGYSPDIAFLLDAAWTDHASREALLARQLAAVANGIGRPAAFELLKSPDLTPKERAFLTESLNTAAGGSDR